MKCSLLLALAAGLVAGGCQSKTVVYTSPGPSHTSSGGTQTINRTVYVNEPDTVRTSTPGMSRKIQDNNTPDRFEAVSQ